MKLKLTIIAFLLEVFDVIFCLNENVTTISARSYQAILSRKRRFLIFPPGSAIVATMSFTKTLVPRSPSGINIIGEYDIFYALQTSVADFYPTTTTPKPVLASVEYEDEQQAGVDGDNANAQTNGNGASDGLNTGEMESNANGDTNLSDIPGLPQNVLVSDPNFNVGKHPGEIYVDMNTSLPPRRYDYSSDYYYNRKYDWAKGNSHRPFDSKKYYYQANPADVNSNSVDESALWHRAENSHASPSPPYSHLYAKTGGRNWYDTRGNYRQNYYNTKSSQTGSRGQPKARNKNSRYKARKTYSVMDDRKRLRMHHAHRERRGIYDQIQSFVSAKGFDIKYCILRMICEANHYLLPPGKSLFEDIFRVLFTVPMHEEFNDEYANAMRVNETECQTVFSEKCRYSILGYMLSKDRPKI